MKPSLQRSTGTHMGAVPGLLDWDGAAARLGVSPRLIRELWAKNVLGGVKVGRYVRFREEDLAAYVEQHRVGPC